MFVGKNNIKILGIFLVLLALILSVAVLIFQPKMHKPFQMSVIEYLIKINADGTATTTTQTTTTILKDK